MKTQELIQWPCHQVATLLFCVDQSQVLLIHKKRGMGAGKINGPGGKLERGESLAECACRETWEETGVTATQPRPAGVLCFCFTDGLRLRVHPYVAEHFSGSLKETEEARPFWQKIVEIPYDQMWPDDVLWLPHVLAGGQAFGEFLFESDTLLEHTLALK